MTQPREFIPTRASLLDRLKDLGDDASWKDFFDTYWRLIYCVALRSGLTRWEAEDVVQETLITVCRRIRRFHYQAAKGSFKSWLLKLTHWQILKQIRRRSQRHEVPLNIERDNDDFNESATTVPPELESFWEGEWRVSMLAAALERTKHAVNSRQFQIFDLSVVHGWPVRRIVNTLKISPAQVYTAKFRVCRRLRQEIAALENDPLHGAIIKLRRDR